MNNIPQPIPKWSLKNINPEEEGYVYIPVEGSWRLAEYKKRSAHMGHLGLFGRSWTIKTHKWEKEKKKVENKSK